MTEPGSQNETQPAMTEKYLLTTKSQVSGFCLKFFNVFVQFLEKHFAIYVKLLK